VPGDLLILIAVLELLVIGEELDWHGFALPRLALRFISLDSTPLMAQAHAVLGQERLVLLFE
jgi:hypothetical protein